MEFCQAIRRGSLLIGVLLFVGCGRGDEAARYQLARGEMGAKDYAAAAAHMERFIADHPDHALTASAYNDLGVAKWRQGDLDAAVIAFENSRSLDPQQAIATYNLGVVVLEQHNAFRAATLFREAAERDETDARALEYAAYLDTVQGRWADAEARLEEALRRAPESPRILASLGLVRLRLEGASQATASLLAALDADPDYAPAYYDLGVVYDRWMNDEETAANFFSEFLDRGGNAAAETAAERRLASLRGVAPTPDDSAPDVPSDTAPDPVDIELPDASPVDVAIDGPTTTPGTVDQQANIPEPFVDRTPPEEPVVVAPPPPPPPPVLPPRATETFSQTHEPVTPPRPETSAGLLELGRRLAGSGNCGDALRAFRDAVRTAEAGGQPDEVETILGEAVAACPGEGRAHYDYGFYLMNEGRSEEAFGRFRTAMALDPTWVPAMLGTAETAVRTGQYETAEAALRRALRLEPGNREALWGMAGLTDFQLNQPDEALRRYRDFIAAFGDDPRVIRARERILAIEARIGVPDTFESPRTAPGRGQLTLIRPRPPGTRPETPRVSPPPADPLPPARGVLAIPKPTVRNRKAAESAFNRATLYQARRDWDRAIEYYIRALAKDDTYALAYYNLGVANYNSGRRELAAAAYRESIRLDPCHVNSRFNLALLLRDNNRLVEATSELEKALQCDANHAQSHYVLGLIYADKPNSRGEATRHFRRVLQLSPNHPAADQLRRWLNANPP